MKKVYILTSNTFSSPGQFLKHKPAYIFHHMMKCGGTSVISVLSKWFNIIPDYHESSDDLNMYINNRINIDLISSDHCIAGHYLCDGTFVHQRYPEIISRKDEIKCFTFLREPLDFFISFYYYSRKFGRMNSTLKDFIESNRNLISYYMGCDEEYYKDVLDRYFFIGITEKLQYSFDILAERLNKPKLKVPLLNYSEKDEQLVLLTEEYIDNFKKYNELDYEIYNYAKSKLNL
ncbi:MAG: hypothetical protein WBQ38_01790 [Ignavibacteria bacterium]|nr:hypothetical protein [Ignavibacteria bacterium]MBK7446908.1 hypothetical protein [Ignavibacteria bacterium]MBK9405374.1 hypothetical protein [Ignavibacteria bacterium]MBL0108267.1 hypothetical protein [Ignavibacteria bacterium]